MKAYKEFFKVFGLGIITFLLVCWTTKFQGAAPYWAEAITFFALAWFISKREEEKKGLSPTAIASALILGRIILELPVRILDYANSVGSLMITINCIIGIILGIICYYGKRTSLYFLSIMIEILLTTFIADNWFEIFIR